MLHKMPGRRLVRRSPVSSEPTDPGEGSSPGDHPDTSSTSVSHDSSTKRRKLDSNNGYVSSPSPSPASPAFRSRPSGIRQRSSLADGPHDDSEEEVDEGKFQPGAIKKVRLTNFVTYTSAEFSLGPSLNMVIGPNGTGKSTLVCALCLGLGFDAKLMGRAEEPADFVKNGSQVATIEIELQGHATAETDTTLTRRIVKDGNKTEFRINGKKVTNKVVLEEARRFSIQIDNLCQFLPQDRVAEFAALTPVELLAATQQAAGREQMKVWQDQLKNLGKEEKKLKLRQTAETDLLKHQKARQAATEQDVLRYRQRQEIQKRLEMLELARPFPKYKVARLAAKEARHSKNEAVNTLSNLQAEVQPSLQALKDKETYLSAIRRAMQHRDRALEEGNQDVTGLQRAIKLVDDELGDVEHKKTAEKNRIQTGRAAIHSAKKKIENLQRQMLDEPAQFDLEGFQNQRRELQGTRAQLDDRIAGLQAEQKTQTEQGRQAHQRAVSARESFERMQGAQGRRLAKLEKLSSDTAKAWDWIQSNQDRFEKPIFGPPIVECAVTDQRYIHAVEALFQKGDFCAITVQTRGDLRKLQDILSNELRLADIYLRTNDRQLSQFAPPLTTEERQALGFDGWALDFLSGPEPVLAMLCTDLRLNVTGVSLHDISDEQYRGIERSPVASWVTGKTSYQITRRREYGPSATSTRTRAVRDATVWTNAPVDSTAMNDLQHQIDGWEEQMRVLQKRNEDAQTEIIQLRTELTENGAALAALERDRTTRQSAIRQLASLPDRLRSEEQRVRDERESIDASLARREQQVDREVELTFKKAQLTVDLADGMGRVTALFEDTLEAFLVGVEAESDVAHLKERSKEVRDQIDQLKQDVQEQTANATRLTAEAKELQKDVIAVVDARGGNAVREFVEKLDDKILPSDLEAMIEQERARIGLIHAGNPNAIKEFEDRERKIKELEEGIAERKQDLEQLEAEITVIRGKWEPELDALISQISDAFGCSFAKIGCAGEVAIKKGDDFSEWAIQILVKFRYVVILPSAACSVALRPV